MELFGTKFTIALGAWRLRFVLMLEDCEEIAAGPAARAEHPHHVRILQNKRAGV
jgi:hypothetical protein